MIKRLVIAVILLTLVGGGIVGFNVFRDQAIEDFFANMPTQPVPVDTVVAEAWDWTPTLEAIGTVFASQGIQLAVETGGVIREIGFKANDRIEEGQILVRIADELEQADLAAAEAEVRRAQQALDRVLSLGDRGIASESTIEEAQAQLSSAQAQVQRIQAQIDQKALEAPFAGEIGIPEIEVGQFVTAGAEVATLQDLDTLRVDFSVPEQSLPLIEIGQPIMISSETGAEATGFITAIEPRIDPATRLVAVRAELDNREGVLSPGQFVRARIALPEEEQVIALPQTAVVTSLYGDYVFAVAPAEEGEEAEEGLIARQVFVETGSRQGGQVEIVEGVGRGDRIVIAGQNRLSNGAPVTLSGEAPADGEAPDDETAADTDGDTAVAGAADPGSAQAAEAAQ